MREVKFRGFCKAIGDEDSDVMIYSGDFIETSEGLICWSFDKNGVPCLEVPILVDDDYGGMGHEQYISTTEVSIDNGLYLMLYTGLKDKNGKEIYEGDIVKLKDFYYEDVIGIVKFGDGEFYVECIPQNNPYSSCIIGMASIDEQDIEVIGNIYEHKHLLEVSKNEQEMANNQRSC